jgi:hypothetical protein
MNKTRSAILATMAPEAPARNVNHTLSQAVYRKLEDQFPINRRATDIEAAIQLGEQNVLRALRSGIVVAA